MTGIAHALIALIQLSLAAAGIAAIRRRRLWSLVLVVAIVVGLAYDNTVLALGGMLDAGSLLEALNAPRYWVHGLLTPAAIWVAFAALAMAGHPAGTNRWWHAVVVTVTLAMVAVGAWIDVVGLDLKPMTEQGITRYVNEFEPLRGPPVTAVVTIIAVLVAGIVLWRTRSWPWLAIGATIMFITAAVPGPILLLQSIGEVAFAAGLVAALAHHWAESTNSRRTVRDGGDLVAESGQISS